MGYNVIKELSIYLGVTMAIIVGGKLLRDRFGPTTEELWEVEQRRMAESQVVRRAGVADEISCSSFGGCVRYGGMPNSTNSYTLIHDGLIVSAPYAFPVSQKSPLNGQLGITIVDVTPDHIDFRRTSR
jgi:hypothetical protein